MSHCHPELVSGSPNPTTFEILKQVQDDRRCVTRLTFYLKLILTLSPHPRIQICTAQYPLCCAPQSPLSLSCSFLQALLGDVSELRIYLPQIISVKTAEHFLYHRRKQG